MNETADKISIYVFPWFQRKKKKKNQTPSNECYKLSFNQNLIKYKNEVIRYLIIGVYYRLIKGKMLSYMHVSLIFLYAEIRVYNNSKTRMVG